MAKPSMTELLSLSVTERIRLAQALWDSIAEVPESIPLTGSDRVELDRRLDAYYQNPEAGSPWPEVREKLKNPK